jgi:hypothetical protein
VDYEAALAAINGSLGEPPRRLDHGDKYTIEPWCYANFGWLAGMGFSAILKRGDVIWAALVQANQALFYPDPENSNWPATVVYSPDLAREPEALIPIAQQLYARKGGGSRNRDLRKIGAALAKETQSTARLKVPTSITGGARCAMTEVAFDRRHMPRGVLVAKVFPILVHRNWRWGVLVPFWHWPNDYRELHWSRP